MPLETAGRPATAPANWLARPMGKLEIAGSTFLSAGYPCYTDLAMCRQRSNDVPAVFGWQPARVGTGGMTS